MTNKYPAWRYHRTLPARIVNDPIEEQELGEGWADRPSAFREPAPEEGPAVPAAAKKPRRKKAE